ALRTLVIDRLVPFTEIAIRVTAAAIEDAPALRPALDDVAFVTLRAGHADRCQQWTSIATLRESAEGQELAVLAHLDDHRATALLAVDACRLILELDALDRSLGFFQRLVERTIELPERRNPCSFTGRDLVQLA